MSDTKVRTFFKRIRKCGVCEMECAGVALKEQARELRRLKSLHAYYNLKAKEDISDWTSDKSWDYLAQPMEIDEKIIENMVWECFEE